MARRLLHEVMEDDYQIPSQEMIPELVLCGELEHRTIILDTGKCIEVDMITYKGKDYAMKIVDGGRWFDESPRHY